MKSQRQQMFLFCRHFTLQEIYSSHKPYLFVAGGASSVPFITLIRTETERRKDLGHPLWSPYRLQVISTSFHHADTWEPALWCNLYVHLDEDLARTNDWSYSTLKWMWIETFKFPATASTMLRCISTQQQDKSWCSGILRVDWDLKIPTGLKNAQIRTSTATR